MVREHPTDVNRAADVIAERLKDIGIPVTMYKPELYLNLPKPSVVKAGGREFRVKAPSMSAIFMGPGVRAVRASWHPRPYPSTSLRSPSKRSTCTHPLG